MAAEEVFDENVGYGDAGEEYSSEIEEERLKRRPSVGAIMGMCLYLEVKKDNFRTIREDDEWEYFYELFSLMASTMTRENLYEFFESDLFPMVFFQVIRGIRLRYSVSSQAGK